MIALSVALDIKAHKARLTLQDAANQDTVMLQYQERTVRLTEDIFINLTFCTLLVVPIVLLMYVPNSSWRLVVVALFIFLSTFLSSFMATATHKPGLAMAKPLLHLALVYFIVHKIIGSTDFDVHYASIFS